MCLLLIGHHQQEGPLSSRWIAVCVSHRLKVDAGRELVCVCVWAAASARTEAQHTCRLLHLEREHVTCTYRVDIRTCWLLPKQRNCAGLLWRRDTGSWVENRRQRERPWTEDFIGMETDAECKLQLWKAVRVLLPPRYDIVRLGSLIVCSCLY